MNSFSLSRVGRLAASICTAIVLGTGAAQADFRGGGSIFAFTDTCAQHGWPVGSVLPVRVRYAASEDNPGGAPPSQVTVAFPTGTEHFTLWGPFTASTTFAPAAGRQIWSFFVYYATAPRLRTVQRAILQRINPAGPDTIPNAREIVLRQRIQNFNNLPGCAVTVASTLRRVN
jgi:hypothetical protein